MKISAQTLFTFLGIRCESSNFKSFVHSTAKTLTSIGFEVEGIEFEDEALKYFVVSKIDECKKHPESDKLSICLVNNGVETFQVLCGAPNVYKGLMIVLAQKGAVIPKNGVVIKKAKIAGYESNGMICSADELLLGKDDGTILELPDNAPIGTPYAHYINKDDAILDISITPNRGDVLSYYGIARELVAQNIGSLPHLKFTEEELKTIEIEVECPEYVPSIFFLKFHSVEQIVNVAENLNKSGIKPTNIPIVDALNYTSELYGQPMHIYDASKIQGTIKVRKSLEGEKLIMISGEEISLLEGDIVVADDEKILSLAGIIGDKRSAVTQDTQEYVLESCVLDRNHIFKSIRKYNIHTSASFRFERYVDYGNAQYFPQQSIAYKGLEFFNAQLTHCFKLQSKKNPTVIVCSIDEISQILGIALTFDEVVDILSKLHFQCIGDEGNLKVTVPSWRVADVKQVHDIAEEIIRCIDINRCPRKVLSVKPMQNEFKIHQMKEFLSRTLDEVITYPFVSEDDYKSFAEDESLESAIILANPINEEMPYMRSCITPSLLHHIAKSESFSYEGSEVYEIAKTFTKGSETLEICIARSGLSPIKNPKYKQREYNIFDIKEDVLLFIENVYKLKRESVVHRNISHQTFHPYQAFEFMIGRNVIATVVQIHPMTLEKYSIKGKTFIANIHLKNIPSKQSKSSIKFGYSPTVLPSVKRELSVIFNQTMECLDILRTLQKIAKNRFTPSVIDVYQGDDLAQDGNKSILIQFDILQQTNTLTTEEIDTITEEAIDALHNIGGVIRTNA
ncbi:MAG: phenylalanyl-tRNA synthetase beta chain [Candidatus Deianiraeaceae bacterium]|jgi:phenylalanyl-tRNA synthetase beta chain